MADTDTDHDQSEKTEQPTPYKLREARKQGNVAKSTEVNTAFAVVAGVILLFALGNDFIHNVLVLCREIFVFAGSKEFSQSSVSEKLNAWMLAGTIALSPVVVILVLAGVLASFVQIGAVFSFQPLKPNLSRLNPVTGFKNRFSKRLLWDTAKTLLKFLVLSTVTCFTMVALLPSVMKYAALPAGEIVEAFLSSSGMLLARLAAVLVVIAILDLLFSRWEYLRKLRMSKREHKDEVKRREGDPAIRSKRKELEAELRKRSASLNNIANADVVITNPTRFAVALEYNRQTMVAPKIIGMGSGAMAKAMRERAISHRVPIICMPRLARRLFKIGRMNQSIPQECYVAAAKALRQVYAARNEVSQGVLA